MDNSDKKLVNLDYTLLYPGVQKSHFIFPGKIKSFFRKEKIVNILNKKTHL
jgi:hypothetical protein